MTITWSSTGVCYFLKRVFSFAQTNITMKQAEIGINVEMHML